MKLRDIASTILLFFEAIWYTIDSVFLWIYLAIAAKNSIEQGKSFIDAILDISYELYEKKGYPVYVHEITISEKKTNEEEMWWR